ncbi:hypothetical protein ACIQTZ_12705 [Paenarthrobacter sp. NPDC090520]|uniref:hypothetical protein n=1 Tax=Paenarthrobacter sp. NPDC090520 TaxID=3364382 RepID=UPI00380E8563
MGDNNIRGEHNSPQPARKVRAVVVPLLALIAVIAGLIAAWNGKDEPMGWFAYAPLSDTVFQPSGGAFVSQGTQIGLLIAVLGLLSLTFWSGFTLGRRRR